MFEERIWEVQGDANHMRNMVAKGIRIVAAKTLGITRGVGPKGKVSQWWGASIQGKLKKQSF